MIRPSRRSSFGSDMNGTQQNRASEVASRYAAMTASRSGGAPGAGGGAGGGGVWNSVAADLGRRQQEEVGHRVLRQPQPGRGQQRQRPDPVRRVDGKLGGDPPAERRADHVRPVKPERVEHVQVVEYEVVDRLGLGKLVRLAEAWMVGRDDLEAGRGEQPVKGKPLPGPAGRVQEQHRFPGPAAQEVHPPPGKLKELLRGNHVCHRAAS